MPGVSNELAQIDQNHHTQIAMLTSPSESSRSPYRRSAEMWLWDGSVRPHLRHHYAKDNNKGPPSPAPGASTGYASAAERDRTDLGASRLPSPYPQDPAPDNVEPQQSTRAKVHKEEMQILVMAMASGAASAHHAAPAPPPARAAPPEQTTREERSNCWQRPGEAARRGLWPRATTAPDDELWRRPLLPRAAARSRAPRREAAPPTDRPAAAAAAHRRCADCWSPRRPPPWPASALACVFSGRQLELADAAKAPRGNRWV